MTFSRTLSVALSALYLGLSIAATVVFVGGQVWEPATDQVLMPELASPRTGAPVLIIDPVGLEDAGAAKQGGPAGLG